MLPAAWSTGGGMFSGYNESEAVLPEQKSTKVFRGLEELS